MAVPETPRRSVFGKLVDGISHFVSTPRSQASAQQQPAQVANDAPAPHASPPPQQQQQRPEAPPTDTQTPVHVPDEAGASPEWNPSLLRPIAHITEMERMWKEVVQTPPSRTKQQQRRRGNIHPRTCPPKNRKSLAIQHTPQSMPRSALKKKRNAMDDDDLATPSRSKRVKFTNVNQERLISPLASLESKQTVPSQSNHSFNRKRPRATDPYVGRQFSDSPNVFESNPPAKKARFDVSPVLAGTPRDTTPQHRDLETGDESTCCSENTPTTQNNTEINRKGDQNDSDSTTNPCLGRPGTYGLNYDTYGENDDLSDLDEEEMHRICESTFIQRGSTVYLRDAAESAAGAGQKYDKGRLGNHNPVTDSSSPEQSRMAEQPKTSRPGRFALDLSDDGSPEQPDAPSMQNIFATPGKPSPTRQAGKEKIFSSSIKSPHISSSKLLEKANTPLNTAVGGQFAHSAKGATASLIPTATNTSSSSSSSSSSVASASSSPPTPADYGADVEEDDASTRDKTKTLTNGNDKLMHQDLSLPIPADQAAAIDTEMSQLPWPRPTSYIDAGIATQEIMNLLEENWDESDDFYSRIWWDREFKRFKEAMAKVDELGSGAELELEF